MGVQYGILKSLAQKSDFDLQIETIARKILKEFVFFLTTIDIN
jgi:hypothetical protein